MLLLSALCGDTSPWACPDPPPLWSCFLALLFLHPWWGSWLKLCPLFQAHGPSLSTHPPYVEPLLGSRVARPHGPLLGHHPGLRLLCAKPCLCPGDLLLFPCAGEEGEGLQIPLPPWSISPCGVMSLPLGWRPNPPLNCREAAGPRAVAALGSLLPTWDQGVPSKAGSILGAFGPSVYIWCSDKLPKAGGQGILGSGRRPGSDWP